MLTWGYPSGPAIHADSITATPQYILVLHQRSLTQISLVQDEDLLVLLNGDGVECLFRSIGSRR